MIEDHSARARFRIGDRVKFSRDGLEALGSKNSTEATRGVVVGFGYKPETVAVVRDGAKTRVSYHSRFWEIAK